MTGQAKSADVHADMKLCHDLCCKQKTKTNYWASSYHTSLPVCHMSSCNVTQHVHSASNTLHWLSLAKLVCKASWKLAIWSWSAFLKPTPTWMGSILLPRPSGIMTPQRVKSLVVLSTVSLLVVPASKQCEAFENTSLNAPKCIIIHCYSQFG